MVFGQRSKVVDAPTDTVYGSGQNASPDEYKRDPEKLGQEQKMNRIAGPLPGLSESDSDSIGVGKQVELEANNAIKYRTCSWPKVSRQSRTFLAISILIELRADSMKTAALLFSEYICLAIMSFPYSYSVLGLVPGLILTVVVAALVLYTSLVIW